MKTCTTLGAVFLLLVLSIGALLVFYPIGFLYATYENLYGEWLQFAAFAGIAIYSFRIVKGRRAPRLWFWVLLGLAGFYTAMEEISWGQQIFGWRSGELFQKNNLQGETNLHNFFTGPYSTLIKDVLTYALAAGMLLYGVVYPLLRGSDAAVARWIERHGVPVPSRCLMPFFLLAAYCEMSFHRFNEAELAELFVALAMLFVAVATYHRRDGDPESDARVAGRSALAFALGLVTSLVLTQISLHSDLSKKRVANRIEAGTKKFAGRYARVGAWEHAIDLYERHLAYEPESRSRTRRLARAYASAGRMAERDATLQRALAMDLDLLEREPWRASLHRSLYRTYRELGQLDKAQAHIREALRINQERLRDHPGSAAAAYSAGRTFELLGRRDQALAQFERAFDLKPESSRYRRAYRDALGR